MYTEFDCFSFVFFENNFSGYAYTSANICEKIGKSTGAYLQSQP